MRFVSLWILGFVSLGCEGVVEGPDPAPASSPDADRPSPDDTNDPGDVPPGQGTPDPTQSACLGGVSPLTRLTRAEIERAVEAALGGTSLGARALPPDETAGPFAANWSQPVSEVWVRKMMEVAEEVAAQNADSISSCDNPSCLEAALAAVAEPLLHRKPTPEDLAQLEALWGAGRNTTGEATAGWRAVLEGLLQSPEFVYRQAPNDPMDAELFATRLAFFLWGEGPDLALRRAASEGQLGTPAARRAAVDRLLDDPRAQWVSARFVEGWLDLSRLTEVSKHYGFLRFDGAARAAMQEETVRFFDGIARRGQGNLHTLMTARWTYAPEALLPIYGLAVPDDFDPHQPITLPNEQRYGVLTHPSVMTVHSTDRHSSPVARGSMILDNLLCFPIELPDLDIPELPEPEPGQTARQRIEQHTSNPACASCHAFIDPLGFSLEHFDAVGAYRTETPYGDPVDDLGALAIGDPADGPAEGARELADRLLASPSFRSCFVQQWMRLGLGRPLTGEDRCVQQELEAGFAASGYDIRSLITELALSPSFSAHPKETDR